MRADKGLFRRLVERALEVLIALDEKNNAVGFIELSIRAYARAAVRTMSRSLKAGTSTLLRAVRGRRRAG